MPSVVGVRGDGFDSDVSPPWLIVSALPPMNNFTVKEVNVLDAVGWTITSEDPTVADITHNTTIPGPAMRMNIFGMARGITHMIGTPPGGTTPVRLMEIEVKARRRLWVAFNLVTDSHFEKTTRTTIANFVSQLRTNVSNLFEMQANIRFEAVGERNIQVRTSLRDIIGKQNRGDLALSGNLQGPYKEWFKLVDEGDSRAEINVFFVPRSILAKENVFRSMVFGLDGAILIEDDPVPAIDRVERALAHWIAIMLGCNQTSDRSKADHLMSRLNDPAARFIPKDCSNILNPTF